MSSHFQPKSLLFYGVMIGSVTILFRLTSAYGETHLKAPPNINGQYLIRESIVGCPENSRLMLIIQQSGVYLTGNLVVIEPDLNRSSDNNSPIGENPSLTGHWHEQTITLSGTTELACQLETQDANPNSPLPLTLKGTLTGEPVKELTGELTLGSTPITFTAEREAIATQPEEH